MAVEEVLHGLPDEFREVEVTTWETTSCYMRLKEGERYVIFGGLGDGPGTVARGACSPSFNVRGNELLLRAIREMQRGGPARIVGSVYERRDNYGPGERAGPGIRVVAERDGNRIETFTVTDGQFEFLDVSPGEWKLEVSSPGMVHTSSYPNGPLIVPALGCEARYLSAVTDGQIRGTVRGADGVPVAGVPVQVFNFRRNGELESSKLAEGLTSKDGNYVITALPSQKYIVGINGEKYSDPIAYLPVYYPQTSHPDKATLIFLGEGEHKDGIDFVLSEPRTPAVLVVEPVFEDGAAAVGAGAKALNLGGVQRAYALRKSRHEWLLRMNLWAGESYVVEASLYDFESQRKDNLGRTITSWEGSAGPIELSAPETGIQVVLRPSRTQ